MNTCQHDQDGPYDRFCSQCGHDRKPDSTWTPEYSPWRHGGWYVHGVRYPEGGIGCVSRNYPDKKWRIVCNHPHEITFKSRDDAARAERLWSLSPERMQKA